MCGICGTAGFANQCQLEEMNAAIVHRGPDDGGVRVICNGAGAPWVGLANRRLSIIDLSPAGHQPMCDAAGECWITFNGEIYNYTELRTELTHLGHSFHTGTDTEVVLAAYRAWGSGCLERFNGMFALVIFDRRDRRVCPPLRRRLRSPRRPSQS